MRAPLRLEIQAVAKNEHEKAEAFVAAFRANFAALSSCISFESYIKPQLDPHCSDSERVVYLLNPTSNHN